MPLRNDAINVVVHDEKGFSIWLENDEAEMEAEMWTVLCATVRFIEEGKASTKLGRIGVTEESVDV